MSVEPPPPDWVTNDAAFHHRRSILDGEADRPTQSIPRVVLQDTWDGEHRAEATRLGFDGRLSPVEPEIEERPPQRVMLIAALRRWSDDVAFSTLRRSQLVATLGFVAVMAMAAYGWQRGTLSNGAADGPIVEAGGAPAAPRLSSDQVTWNDVTDADSRRSTASFAPGGGPSDRADDDEPDSGAKLFVADGKKSSKGVASRTPDSEPTDRATGDTGGGPAGGTTPVDLAPTGGKRTSTTVSVAVRYESCAEAAAAGAVPIRLGEPGYRLSLDRDKDGIACENGSTPEDRGDAPVDSSYSNPTTTVPPRQSTTTTAPGAGAGTTTVAEATTITQTPTSSKPTTTKSTSTTTTTASTRRTSTSTTNSTTTSTTPLTSTTSEPTTSTTVGSTTSSPATTGPTTSTTEATTTSSSTTSTSAPTTLPATTTTEQPPVETQPTDSSNPGPT